MFETRKKKQKIEELNNQIFQLQAEINKKNYELDKANGNLRTKMQEVANVSKEVNAKKQELGLVNGIVEMQELGMEYTPAKDCLSDIELKINKVDDKIASMISNKQITITSRTYTVDNSASKGAMFQQTFCNNLVMGFNSYYEKKAKAVTTANYPKTVELLNKKFLTFEKYFSFKVYLFFRKELMPLSLKINGIVLFVKLKYFLISSADMLLSKYFSIIISFSCSVNSLKFFAPSAFFAIMNAPY